MKSEINEVFSLFPKFNTINHTMRCYYTFADYN